ncbi:mitogen-activated protein kinase 3, putative [Ichthyophthirius multifiliis]|uniref:Mitogen-activated protein kinase 3, putative n=1 Tax=Ichthyophthirius multifiliis TaxID=5932 RepID=G0R1F0_ICHMU|nr:mitogen-activated protein kinase 3, putative [Ichthyophthirius multifiliis]EGR28707.1 mitogen-activated protein kinase 3, putative [Ichthyophthirius multifiliis]|eukprot:XP_004029943.1 mitogen-activated protein kinase 3, putative [Ichthyophthirius multifiliis]
MDNTKSYSINGSLFRTGERYESNKLLGCGAYGQVVMAKDKQTNKNVAIKKLHKIEDIVDAKRVLREIRILRNLLHENILQLQNILYDDHDEEQEFGTIYLVTNYMEIDLYQVIKSNQPLTDQHVQYIIYQILKGLKYIHSANIIHRDIKPSNLLATEKCDISMCDFGLSRKIEDEEQEEQQLLGQLTEYVVTRYYRAPEIMLSSHLYSKAIDMWSLGCTFAELITHQILFKADNYIKQIKLIFEKLGMPSDEDLSFIGNQNAKQYVESLQKNPRVSVKSFIKYENPLALDLLDKMLEINPSKRLTAEEALAHPYLESLHDEIDEPKFEGNINFDFESDQSITSEQLRAFILEEVNYYKALNKENSINIQDALNLCKKKEEQIKKNQNQNKKD